MNSFNFSVAKIISLNLLFASFKYLIIVFNSFSKFCSELFSPAALYYMKNI